MATNSWKPKEWVGITSGPNCIFTIVRVFVLLFKGITQLPYLFYFAPILFFFALFTQPCLVLNNNTTNSAIPAICVISKVCY
jgi:hypothetical protein